MSNYISEWQATLLMLLCMSIPAGMFLILFAEWRARAVLKRYLDQILEWMRRR